MHVAHILCYLPPYQDEIITVGTYAWMAPEVGDWTHYYIQAPLQVSLPSKHFVLTTVLSDIFALCSSDGAKRGSLQSL